MKLVLMAACVRGFLLRPPHLVRPAFSSFSTRTFSSSYDMKGSLKKIGEVMKFDSGFMKREVVVLTEEAYPQEVKVEFLGDNSRLLEKFDEGDFVTVSFNIKGREWQEKHYVSLTGWRIQLEKKSNDNATENNEAFVGNVPF